MLALKCTDEEVVNYRSLKLMNETSKWLGPTKAGLEDD
jgi:hypothetical protein